MARLNSSSLKTLLRMPIGFGGVLADLSRSVNEPARMPALHVGAMDTFVFVFSRFFLMDSAVLVDLFCS